MVEHSENKNDWRAEVQALYEALDRELDAPEEWCQRRGVCCDFRTSDEQLFATEVEVAYLLAARSIPEADGVLCPFWRRGLCEAREHRPLGCRTYFCHPAGRDRGNEVYRHYHRRLKEIGEAAGIPYRYSLWVRRLADATG